MNKQHTLKRIKLYLLSGRPLTALDAFKKFSTLRLAAYINMLKNKPHSLEIKSEDVKMNGKVFSRYFIPRKPKVNRITDGSYLRQAELKR